jgi:hypothetical protein
MYVHRHDPNAIVKYTVDWAAILPATIASATWIGATGLTQSGVSNDTRYHRLTLAAPTLGTTYRVTSRVTASDGQVYDYSFLIVGKED